VIGLCAGRLRLAGAGIAGISGRTGLARGSLDFAGVPRFFAASFAFPPGSRGFADFTRFGATRLEVPLLFLLKPFPVRFAIATLHMKRQAS
jgi:hypothetical protein